MDIITSAGGVLLNNENKLFLIHKIKKDEWSLPKGKQELDESIVQAAKREIEEETGYSNIVLACEEQIGHDYFEFTNPETNQKAGKNVYYFLFKVTDNDQDQTKEMAQEGLDGKWVNFDEALKMVSFDNLKPVIQSAKDHLATIKVT